MYCLSKTRLYSLGYASHLCRCCAWDFRRVAEELKIVPVTWIDDVEHFSTESVNAVQNALEQQRQDKVTR
jgi:hypothetical protein